MSASALRRVQRIRKINNENLPSWYRWKLHLIINTNILCLSCILGLSLLSRFTAYYAILFSIYFIGWAFIEYFIHRFVLHGSFLSNLRFKRQHTFFHHGYFTKGFIEAKSGIDLNRILLFPADIVSLLGMNALVSSIVYFTFSHDSAFLFFSAGAAYLIVYEVAHAYCHSGIKTKNKVLSSIQTHHALHHDQAIMKTKNFSVLIPYLDQAFGSKAETASVNHV